LLFTAGVLRTSAAGTTTEGCMNQWLFNGVWRVQVTKVEPFMDAGQQVGWQVTQVWHNGTGVEIAPGDSFPKDQVLTLSNGSTIVTTATTTGSLSQGALWSHDVQTAGQYTHVQIFRSPTALDPTNKPTAVDIAFDASKLAQARFKPQFTTHQPDYHIKLDCTASASAQAQGGATQMAATPGCLNQWMSNGVWRMRATAVAPDMGNDNSGPQIGWMVTQDWTNMTKRSIAPGDTAITDQQLVLANGDTVASSNSTGTSLNFGQLANRTFAPGSSFTYQQRFRGAPFDATNKPTGLLVTFDAKAEKQRSNNPQYTGSTPNFRISLECSK
jgi:hypothetical protein